MNSLLIDGARVVLVGIGATAVMDLWLLFLKRIGVPALDIGLIGRWFGHLLRGKLAHAAIAQAAPVKSEVLLGWLVHYAVGIVFAAALALFYGLAWTRNPSLLPALIVGIGSVAAPWFVMQPAMGAGFASSKTAAPLKNCARSLANHAVFGAGLYLAALCITGLAQ